jgi:hypothetical protein
MGASIDNFWLCLAVQHGLPAPFLMLLAFFSIFSAVGFRKGLDAKLIEYRMGFLTTMTAFFLVAWAVHFWDAAYVLFLFLMGSGVWMLDVRPKERAALQAQTAAAADNIIRGTAAWSRLGSHERPPLNRSSPDRASAP